MNTDDMLALTPLERLALIAELWESLGSEPPLPGAQAAELSRRLQSFAQDRHAATPWDALRTELASRPG